MWGKHLHGCSARTDKCHFNLSRITFTPLPDSTEDSGSLKCVSFICWQPFTPSDDHAIMADKSIVLPACDQIRITRELAVFYYPNWVTCLEYFKILEYVEIWGRPGSRRQKHVPLLFSHKTWKLPSSDPESHRVKDHGCLHSPLIHTALSDQTAAGMHQTAVPTSHVLSSQNTGRPQEFMCELR